MNPYWSAARYFQLWPPPGPAFDIFGAKAKLPESPTSCLGRTSEKIEVMAARAARGETLFHPHDAVCDDALSRRKLTFLTRTRNNNGGVHHDEDNAIMVSEAA